MHIRVILVLIAVSLVPFASAKAQVQPSSPMIVGQLLPDKAGPLVRSMDAMAKRSINPQQPLDSKLDLPRVNLFVNFEQGSAKLTTTGMLALRSLAKALLDPQLSEMRFQVAGYPGRPEETAQNPALPHQRAQTVVNHLVNFYEIPRAQLIPVGYGHFPTMSGTSRLQSVNQKVEIVNLNPLS